jgi:hypothetical protein
LLFQQYHRFSLLKSAANHLDEVDTAGLILSIPFKPVLPGNHFTIHKSSDFPAGGIIDLYFYKIGPGNRETDCSRRVEGIGIGIV